MAYTYDDFVTAAKNAGLLEKFGEDDLKIAQTSPEYGLSVLKLTQDLQSATTTEQQLLAQEALNQLKQSYGSFGTTATTGAASTYGNETEYQKLLNEAVNQEAFSYDAAQDPSYSALKKTYLREGERAKEDTLAKVSAATGGTPSSYAVTAAQQSGDYYAEQLADQIPTLEQNAYQKYLNDYNLKLSTLDTLRTDRNQELEKQQAAAELMASAGDYSLLAQLYGLTDEQLAKLQGTTGSGGTGSTGSGNDETAADYSWLQAVYPTGVIDSASWAALIAAGWTEEELAAAGFKQYTEPAKLPLGKGAAGGTNSIWGASHVKA